MKRVLGLRSDVGLCGLRRLPASALRGVLGRQDAIRMDHLQERGQPQTALAMQFG